MAAAAGVSKRTLYARFAGKAALLQVVVARLVAAWLPTFDAEVEQACGLEAVLLAAARVMLATALAPEALALHRLIVSEIGRFPELARVLQGAGAGVGLERLTATLARFGVAEPGWAAEQFMALVLAVPQRRALGPVAALDAAARERWATRSVALFLHGAPLVAERDAALANADDAAGRPGRDKNRMKMTRLFGLALALAAAGSASAMAAPERARLRGTVSAVSGDTLSMHTIGGEDVAIMLGRSPRVVKVTRSSLASIVAGSHIGSATKTVGSTQVALEVLIFPPGMRGTADGQFAWDSIPDTTLPGGGLTASSMTNGKVVGVGAPAQKAPAQNAPAQGAAAPDVMTPSTMTNGSVAAVASEVGSERLTVTYKGGQQIIVVPPTAPIVTFTPGAMSDVTQGASVFVNGTTEAGRVTAEVIAVGSEGLKPPM